MRNRSMEGFCPCVKVVTHIYESFTDRSPLQWPVAVADGPVPLLLTARRTLLCYFVVYRVIIRADGSQTARLHTLST